MIFLYGCFQKYGVFPQNGWFIMENLIKMDDLGGPPLFLETPISLRKLCLIKWPSPGDDSSLEPLVDFF